jgi:two-component system sensor histidine kinase QseC
MKLFSARRLLILVLVAVVSSVSLLAAGLSYREARIEVDELFDAKLAHSARVLSALIDPAIGDKLPAPGEPQVIEVWHSEALGQGDALVSSGGHAYETKLAFQVRTPDGQLLMRSDSGPQTQLMPLAPGFGNSQIGAELWRVFTLRSPHGLWVQAAESDEIRDELAGDIARGTLAPMLLALPILAVLVWLVVAWASQSLARVSMQIEQRAADSLQPLALQGVPEELRALVQAIDGLLERLRDALSHERRFSADAAHELKTPLAALRVHAANLRTAATDEERAHSQRRLDDGIARMDRLVSQLLHVEREESADSAQRNASALDLVACARLEIDELVAAGLAHDIRIELGGAPHAITHGDALSLSVMVRNLVDNALRYTPQGGQVQVQVAESSSGCELIVDDSGPGIAEDERARAFERFHRGLGHAASGSGLGLSIARRVVERHRGALVLSTSPLGGLRVTVCLPHAGGSRSA